MKKVLFSILTLAFIVPVFYSCKPEIPDGPEQENILSETSVTGHAESISPLGATLVCYANLPADIPAGTSFGVLYSTDANPIFESANSRTSNELNSNNQYSITISGLLPATKYYFRSFVNQNGILKYGHIKDFATTDAKIVSTGKAEKVSAISASIPVVIDLTVISPEDVRVGVCFSIESETPELYVDSSVEGNLDGDTCSITLMALSPSSTYHYRAYAIIDGSQIYGDCLSFTTGQDCLATTNEATEISHIAAIVTGQIDLTNCSYQSATWGICYDDGNNPSLESNVITVERIVDGTITANISGLEPDKVYYYRAFATIDNSTHYGAILYFRTPALYKEHVIENISSVSAIAKTTYNMADTKYANMEFGICYNEKGNPSVSDLIKVATIDDTGLVKVELLGLNQGTRYYVRPYTKLDGVLLYGEEKEFTTLGLVTYCSADCISGVSATLAASYDLSNALYNTGEFGVRYGTSSNPTHIALGEISEGSVSVVISALQSNTKYYYQGYAKLDGKVYCGEIKSFTTNQFVKSSQISNISPISATAMAEYDLTNAVLKSSVYGVCLSTNEIPTINDIKVEGNLNDSSAEVNIKKLTPATSYNYRGYAIVDGVTHYGEVKKFSTGECRFFSTGVATDITHWSATISTKFNLGNSMFDTIVYGICYSENAAPTIADLTITTTPDDSGEASFALKNLLCSTEYYYKPYVTVDGATYYGTQRIFETAWDPFVVAELEAGRLVDLGLSVHWATYNVGASKPEDVGNLYAWGEITPKDTYTWRNYKFTSSMYNDHPVFSKYDTGLVTLEADDDVACARLGGTYRMPTKEEFEELLEKCSWEITTVNGIKGYKATGPSGKSIFFPTILKMVSSTEIWQVHYWSKTPYYYAYGGAYWQETAWALYLYVNTSTHSTNRMDRYIGYPVRAISPY